MESIDENVETLINMGLTQTQARIYISNFQTGPATVKQIGIVAEIAREDVYRVLPSLITMGLTKKHLTSPTMYESVEPKHAIDILLKTKQDDYIKAKQKSQGFLKRLGKQSKSRFLNDEKTVWVYRNKKSPVDPKAVESVKYAQKSIDFTTTYTLFTHSMNNQFLKDWITELYRAVNRGIIIRMALNMPKTGKPVNKISFLVSQSNGLVRHENFKIKYLEAAPECIVLIVDDKKCLIETSPEDNEEVSPFLWTSNPVLVKLASTYFRETWNVSSEK